MQTTEDYGHGVIVTSDSMSATLTVDGRKVRHYTGETAWSDAERDASDVVLKRVYA
jgi:hypothetical protein